MVNGVRFVISKKISLWDQGPVLITQEASDIDIRMGMENASLASLRKGSYILLQLVITINQKNISRL